jgi:hypothetical protein
LVLPGVALANIGIPMLVVAWPTAWVLLLPVILTEMLIAERILGLTWRQGLRLSTYANVVSTLIGIPLTWCLMFAAEMGVFLIVDALHVSNTALDSPLAIALFPLLAAWIGPGSKWQIWAAGAALCLPFWAASTWIEARAARRWLRRNDDGSGKRQEQVKRWTIVANTTTYSIIAAIAIAFAVGSR